MTRQRESFCKTMGFTSQFSVWSHRSIFFPSCIYFFPKRHRVVNQNEKLVSVGFVRNIIYNLKIIMRKKESIRRVEFMMPFCVLRNNSTSAFHVNIRKVLHQPLCFVGKHFLCKLCRTIQHYFHLVIYRMLLKSCIKREVLNMQ